jgi:hypothetical protein
MFLIASGDFVTSGLSAEYGRIPPTFLPVQNKRLYEHQLALINDEETIVLSLPEGIVISEYDNKILTVRKVKIVHVPVGLSLGQSIIYVLNVVGKYQESVKILHGDTLFKSLPKDVDVLLVSKTDDNYDWAVSETLKKENFVYAGYFSFSNQSKLIKSITESDYNFIKGIISYKKQKPVIEEICEMWLDFGHSNTFYKSKTTLTTERSFNNLKIDGFSVVKSSNDDKKILAEANWFKNMPLGLKKYIPSLWDSGTNDNKGFYQIEYLHLSSLAELFVFGENELFVWQNILKSCNEFLMDCSLFIAPKYLNKKKQTNSLYGEKTSKRIQIYAQASNIDLDKEWVFNDQLLPSLNAIISEMNDLISLPSYTDPSIMHGDFCFSNILYNFRTQTIKVIDPRGVDEDGNETIYGDVRYDIGKIAHSVIGLYDFIIAGYYSYQELESYSIKFEIYSNPTIEKIQAYYENSSMGGMTMRQACTYPILIHLFLSMLPLHNDNPLRQKAMLANALRLYVAYKNKNS